jgi:hypothetical protein
MRDDDSGMQLRSTMVKIAIWMILLVVIVVAGGAAALVAVSYWRPAVDHAALMRFNSLAMNLGAAAFAVTLVSGLTVSWMRRPRRGREEQSVPATDKPRYVRLLIGAMVAAFIQCWVCGYASVLQENGRWLLTGRSSPREVPEGVALDWMWRDLRTLGAMGVILTIMWILLLAAELRRRSRGAEY